MAYKDDLCENSASVKPRPTRHRAQDYALGVSGLETEEDKEIRRLYEESVFGPRPLSASLTKVGCPEITPLGDSTVDSLRSVEKKRFVPPPAHFSTSDMGAALTSSSDERENYSQHVWFDNQSQKSVTPQHRKKIPPPIAPKPNLPPGRLNGYPETSGARPKTQVIPPGSIYLPNKEDLARDLYADGTQELRRYAIRICDICRMEYLACLYKMGNLDKQPFGSKGRICDECVEECPEQSSVITVERRKKPRCRACDPPSTQGSGSAVSRNSLITHTTKAEMKFYEPNLAKIPPIYDSDEDKRKKLDAVTEELAGSTAGLSCD